MQDIDSQDGSQNPPREQKMFVQFNILNEVACNPDATNVSRMVYGTDSIMVHQPYCVEVGDKRWRGPM